MSQTTTVTTYIEELAQGSLFAEDYVREVDVRNPQRDAAGADRRIFAFRYYDIETTWGELVGGGQAKLGSKKVNISGFYYIDAEKLSVDDVRALEGDNRILISRMEGNGWDHVARCRTGNFRPMEDGDTVIRL